MKNKFILLIAITAGWRIFSFGPVDLDPQDTFTQRSLQVTEQELRDILQFIKGQETGCSWIAEYPLVVDLIKQYQCKVGCEIGVAYGGQSEYLLENSDLTCLYSIDPYQHFETGYQDFMNFSQKYHDVLFFKVARRLKPYGNRSVLVRQTSEAASRLFADESLDFVYIDANHSYEAVKQDLELWVPKVKRGGLLVGDDYVVFPTTAYAVHEFVIKHGYQLYTSGNKWWFIK